MNEIKQRAKNAMIGLAIGDSISWTSMFHRSVLLPQWTRRIRREIDASSETTNVLLTPMPFSLNQPAKYLIFLQPIKLNGQHSQQRLYWRAI